MQWINDIIQLGPIFLAIGAHSHLHIGEVFSKSLSLLLGGKLCAQTAKEDIFVTIPIELV